eukprot:GHVS01070184.1.p1 GENE.GHVS01070184.1~~GHVS01070184.1.p1  ORF type:complete len:390 (+),score=115.49 GHVS01070184.1:616-1785(+)
MSSSSPTCVDPSDPRLSWLFLGNKEAARHLRSLKALRIRYIVNATPTSTNGGVPNYFERDPFFSYCRIPIQDNASENLQTHFDEFWNFLETARIREDGNVLIHCNLGISRSVSLVCSYAIKYFPPMTASDILQRIQIHRSIAKPNDSFMQQLQQLSSRTSSTSSTNGADVTTTTTTTTSTNSMMTTTSSSSSCYSSSLVSSSSNTSTTISSFLPLLPSPSPSPPSSHSSLQSACSYKRRFDNNNNPTAPKHHRIGPSLPPTASTAADGANSRGGGVIGPCWPPGVVTTDRRNSRDSMGTAAGTQIGPQIGPMLSSAKPNDRPPPPTAAAHSTNTLHNAASSSPSSPSSSSSSFPSSFSSLPSLLPIGPLPPTSLSPAFATPAAVLQLAP